MQGIDTKICDLSQTCLRPWFHGNKHVYRILDDKFVFELLTVEGFAIVYK